jgi:hypothetical protein
VAIAPSRIVCNFSIVGSLNMVSLSAQGSPSFAYLVDNAPPALGGPRALRRSARARACCRDTTCRATTPASTPRW